MPEVILPCPECGDDECLIVLKQYPSEEWSVHCGCGHIGRFYPTRKKAIDAHNALPRALRWTNEPPKVAGVYLIRSIFDGKQQGEIGVITVKTPFGYDKSHFMQFAGPIALPVEVLAS